VWSVVVSLLLALGPSVSCADGGGAGPVAASHDAIIGPLAILGAPGTVRERRDAFDRRGWKLPVSLRSGETATLVAPRGVGLVFTPDMAPQRSVTFRACSGEGPTGWPGGIVVDRRRCATLRVWVAGAIEPIRQRVPLGARC
jgi:hypothetical protein